MTLRHGIKSSCRSLRDILSVRLISLVWRSGRMQRAVACLKRCPQMSVSLPTGQGGDLAPATPALLQLQVMTGRSMQV